LHNIRVHQYSCLSYKEYANHASILAAKKGSVKMYNLLVGKESGEVWLLRQSGREGERGEYHPTASRGFAEDR